MDKGDDQLFAWFYLLKQTPKKSQFTLKRKKSTKPVDEWGDLVCPLGPSGDQDQNSCSSSSSSTTTTNNNQTNVSPTVTTKQIQCM